jgi:hypothetical protein
MGAARDRYYETLDEESQRLEAERRHAQLGKLKGRYEQLMADARAELDRAMAEGQIVRVAGFVRSCKGKKRKR